MSRLNVGIDVRVTPGLAGGVAPAVGSLVGALGALRDGPEQYTIVIGSEAQQEWLTPLMGPNQRLVMRPRSRKERLLGPMLPMVRYIQNLLAPPRYWPEVPMSDGFYESLGCDVMHFPTQSFTVCAVRSVYNPIDLQHLHHPEFFDPWTIAWRETVYRAGCQVAQALIVNSTWIKEDVVRHYRVDPDKIRVVPEAPPTSEVPEPAEPPSSSLGSKYQLEMPFLIYPAVTWPHKNHVRLFRALAYLRDERGLRVQLVCTGSRFDPFWPTIQRCVTDLSLDTQVRFVGLVPREDLRGLYRLAAALVLPSLFEANSLPVFEAWVEGTPVACANLTGLPEQVEDAALLFDPYDPVSIADAIQAIIRNPETAAALRSRGHLRSSAFSWRRTAEAYRDIYRCVAGRPRDLTAAGSRGTPLHTVLDTACARRTP